MEEPWFDVMGGQKIIMELTEIENLYREDCI